MDFPRRTDGGELWKRQALCFVGKGWARWTCEIGGRVCVWRVSGKRLQWQGKISLWFYSRGNVIDRLKVRNVSQVSPVNGELWRQRSGFYLLSRGQWMPSQDLINRLFLRPHCGHARLFHDTFTPGMLQPAMGRRHKQTTAEFNEEEKAVHFHVIDFYSLFTCLLRVISFTCYSSFPTAQHFSQGLLSYWLSVILPV